MSEIIELSSGDDDDVVEIDAPQEKGLVKRRKKQESPGPSKKKKKNEEKREGRLRICTIAIKDRIDRALAQRLFLISRRDVSKLDDLGCAFAVLGTTGNVYDVLIGKTPHCSCPDFGKGVPLPSPL